jgi:flagellar hook-basal body complex protein FliE
MSIPPIGPLTAPTPLLKPQAIAPAAQPASATFSQALDALNQSQAGSDALLQKLAAGENVDLHQVIIAAEQTDVNFRVAIAMRDRLVEAYHEVMRMNV